MGDATAEGDFDVIDHRARGQLQYVGQTDAGAELDIVDGAAGGVVEVAVFGEVRAVAGGFPLEVDLAYDAVLDEGFEAFVDGGQGNVRDAVLDAHEDLVGGRVIPAFHEDAVDFLALPRHAEPGDFRREVLGGIGFGEVLADHGGGKLAVEPHLARMILVLFIDLGFFGFLWEKRDFEFVLNWPEGRERARDVAGRTGWKSLVRDPKTQ